MSTSSLRPLILGYASKEKAYFSQPVTDENHLGFECDNGSWNGVYKNITIIRFKDKAFWCGQREDNKSFFIQPIGSNGKLETTTFTTTWREYHPSLASIYCEQSDRCFLARHRKEVNSIFIQEVSKEGELIGEITSSANLDYFYEHLLSVNIGSNTFLIGHSSKSSRRRKNAFFIKEIHENGIIGKDKTKKDWTNFYVSMCTVSVGGKVYIAAQTEKEKKKFFLQEINSRGELAPSESYRKEWGDVYQSLNSINIGDKAYIIGQTTSNNQKFFIQEVNRNGTMVKNESFSVRWGNFYDNLLVINNFIAKDKIYGGNDWMKKLPETTLLKDISIPGTHQSGADLKGISGGSTDWARCQDKSIREQLNMGVRFLDIRCRSFNGIFTIHHGNIYQEKIFDGVLDDCIAFLEKNKSETIIMRLADEKDRDNFDAIFINKYKNFKTVKWYGLDNQGKEKSQLSLEDLRGHILLLNNSPIQNCKYNFRSFFDEIQDRYNRITKDQKWGIVKEYLDNARKPSNSGKLFLNHCSAVRIPTDRPISFANYINPKVGGYLNDNKLGRYGAVAFDFAPGNVIRKLIDSNANKWK